MEERKPVALIQLEFVKPEAKTAVLRTPSSTETDDVLRTLKDNVFKYAPCKASRIDALTFLTTVNGQLVDTPLDDIVRSIVKRKVEDEYEEDYDEKADKFTIHVEVECSDNTHAATAAKVGVNASYCYYHPTYRPATSSNAHVGRSYSSWGTKDNSSKLSTKGENLIHQYVDMFCAQSPEGVLVMYPSSRKPQAVAGHEDSEFWYDGFYTAVFAVQAATQEDLDVILTRAIKYIKDSRYPLLNSLYKPEASKRSSEQIKELRASKGANRQKIYKPYADKGTVPKREPFTKFMAAVQERKKQHTEQKPKKKSKKRSAGVAAEGSDDGWDDSDAPEEKRACTAQQHELPAATPQQQQQTQRAAAGRSRRKAAAPAAVAETLDLDNEQADAEEETDSEQQVTSAEGCKDTQRSNSRSKAAARRVSNSKTTKVVSSSSSHVVRGNSSSSTRSPADATVDAADTQQHLGKVSAGVQKAIASARAKAAKKEATGSRQVQCDTDQLECLFGEEINYADKPKAAARQKKKEAAEVKATQAQQQQQVAAVKQRRAQHDSQRSARYPARARNHTAKALSGNK